MQATNTVICRTYVRGDCIEVVHSVAQGKYGHHYYVTINGAVRDARRCWISDGAARERYDEAGYKLGERP